MNTVENNNRDKEQFCSQCPNHCSIDSLKCGRGRSYFQSQEADTESQEERRNHGNRGEHENHGDHGYHGDHRDSRSYENRESHGGGNHRGHGAGQDGKPHGRREFDSDSLFGLMRGCGHFLYHKNGQGMGTSQERILSILVDNENMTQKELQEILQIQPGSISEILAKLEDKNLIIRQKDEEDKRRSTIKLTEEGKTVGSIKQNKNSEEQIFSCLSEDEQQELRRLLMKLNESWKAL